MAATLCHRILFSHGLTSRISAIGLTHNHTNRLISPIIRHYPAIPRAAKQTRNVAIVAHVDHGKTTLVDKLLQQSGTLSNVEERLMDNIQLEKERGITIMSKVTRLDCNDMTLNVVDTPGHQDFGGEVERVLDMVDGIVLVVDASDGPMSQTKFVLGKALKKGLNPIVVLNKVDRDSAKLDGSVEDSLFDLFVNLGANDSQLDFPVLYASAKMGWAVSDIDNKRENMQPLFETIIKHVPPPADLNDEAMRLLVTTVSHDPYFGQVCTGKISSGRVQIGDPIHSVDMNGVIGASGKISRITARRGHTVEDLTEAFCGDIVSLSGIGSKVTSTICSPSTDAPLPASPIDPPTISLSMSVNDSPLAGKDGKFLTSSHLKERLRKETENNVAIQIRESSEKTDAIEVFGRGELQLGILIEQMRREGFEMSLSPPRVLFEERDGVMQEPYEEVTVDVESEYSSLVMKQMNDREGVMQDYSDGDANRVRLIFKCSSRALLGFPALLKRDTKGTAVLHSIYTEHLPVNKSLRNMGPRHKLISVSEGTITEYALKDIQDKAKMLFVRPGDQTYCGMVIGEHQKDMELWVNSIKTKKATNVRTKHSDHDNTQLFSVRTMPLEEMLVYMEQKEILEITPTSIRLRKSDLTRRR